MEETGQLLLRIWLADAPLDVTEAEYSALAACFEGGTWGNWHFDPLSPREDWPDGLAYLIDRLEAEADEFTTPGKAWRRCGARFISLKRRRLAASLEPEAVENNTPAADEDYMPAAWFTSKTQITSDMLRKATRQDRKAKRVRFTGTGKDKRYSKTDARQHWPDRFSDRAAP